jgi:hypothetical protein
MTFFNAKSSCFPPISRHANGWLFNFNNIFLISMLRADSQNKYLGWSFTREYALAHLPNLEGIVLLAWTYYWLLSVPAQVRHLRSVPSVDELNSASLTKISLPALSWVLSLSFSRSHTTTRRSDEPLANWTALWGLQLTALTASLCPIKVCSFDIHSLTFLLMLRTSHKLTSPSSPPDSRRH